jgi:hypothetical protein
MISHGFYILTSVFWDCKLHALSRHRENVFSGRKRPKEHEEIVSVDRPALDASGQARRKYFYDHGTYTHTKKINLFNVICILLFMNISGICREKMRGISLSKQVSGPYDS